MSLNPLIEVQQLGQSIWYDNIRRSLLLTGDLESKIAKDGLRGVTSNPAIFEKAIAGSTDYNESLDRLAREGSSVEDIYEAFVVEDIQMAADLLEPVYEETNGQDGYVSLEVSPLLAHDAEVTINEAKRLWNRLERNNVMIKVPATQEGFEAIEELIGAGINVNVTLIFSRQAYEKVAEAFISGLEQRMARGERVDRIASVASFFVSRIDTAVDKAVQFEIQQPENEQRRGQLSSLLGKVAIANAKLAYQRFKEIFGEKRFQALAQNGAQPQRLLWASTGTKNPNYSDVLYVESLIGPDTVNTVPPATFTAFRDHGRAGSTLEENLEGAQQTLVTLKSSGIDLEHITDELLVAAVKAFVDPFEKLMKTIEDKHQTTMSSIVERQSASLGEHRQAVLKTIKHMEEFQFVRRLWRKDASLWKADSEIQETIRESLGWLTAAQTVLEQVDELHAFVEEVRQEGFRHVLLLGMGGSSLCPEVFRRTFGEIEGYPKLLVLDSTDPATVRHLEQSVEVTKTLFVVASKSGTTTEPLMFYSYFFDRVSQAAPDQPARQFVAITDPGTKLEQTAEKAGCRRIFRNMPDIGGRYSALSFFGMVPAALMGIDIREMLERATTACEACERCVPTADNPAARLGAILGELARRGRDKVTLITSPPIDSLGLWIEQLIAESTGKENTGILPVAGEPLGSPAVYGDDRLFVHIRTSDAGDPAAEAKLTALENAGHPVIRHVMRDPLSLGREFFLWEFATALAGALLGINTFDQPNVQESKENTRLLLEVYGKEAELPAQELLVEGDGCRIYGESPDRRRLQPKDETLAGYVAAHLDLVKAGDYVALTAYIPETAANDGLLQEIRVGIRDELKVATTVGYGPRFLHSTGQLHKGGADNGLFIQITADDVEDLPIPGQTYTFGLLQQAQALGDFQSLSNRNRRSIRFHLGSDVQRGLEVLLNTLRTVTGTTA